MSTILIYTFLIHVYTINLDLNKTIDYMYLRIYFATCISTMPYICMVNLLLCVANLQYQYFFPMTNNCTNNNFDVIHTLDARI